MQDLENSRNIKRFTKTELKPFHSIGIVKSNASLQDSLKLRAAPRHSGGEAGGGLLRL